MKLRLALAFWAFSVCRKQTANAEQRYAVDNLHIGTFIIQYLNNR